MAQIEVPLSGGNVAAGVVRLGRTVRKPVTPATPAVQAVLRHLEQVGFAGAPRPLGRDEQGRQVLEYVEGPLAHALPPMAPADLACIGRLVRHLHDALASFTAPTTPAGRLRSRLTATSWCAITTWPRGTWSWATTGGCSRLGRRRARLQAVGPRLRRPVLHTPARRRRPRPRRVPAARPGRRVRRRSCPATAPADPDRGAHPSMYTLLVDGARTGRQPWPDFRR